MRLFVLNGIPLQYKGKYAAFRQIPAGDDRFHEVRSTQLQQCGTGDTLAADRLRLAIDASVYLVRTLIHQEILDEDWIRCQRRNE